jgi:uncharacterized Zn-finger protein
MNNYIRYDLSSPILPNSFYPNNIRDNQNTAASNTVSYPNNNYNNTNNVNYNGYIDHQNSNSFVNYQNSSSFVNYQNSNSFLNYQNSSSFVNYQNSDSFPNTNNLMYGSYWGSYTGEKKDYNNLLSNENTITELNYLNLSTSHMNQTSQINQDNDGKNITNVALSEDSFQNDKTKDYKKDRETTNNIYDAIDLEQDNENYYDSLKEINIEEYNNYEIIKSICNVNVNNYLKKHHSQRFDKVCSSMMTSIHSTNVDVLTDIFFKIYFTNLNIYESNLYLIVRIENMTIIKIPYLFLKQWLIYENKNEYEFSEYIRIPLEILCGDIHLHLLSKSLYKTIMVEMHYFKYELYPQSISEFIDNGECVFVGKYLNSQTKKLYHKQDSTQYPMQLFQSMYIKECNHYHLKVPCKFKKSTKGFILIGEEISDITNLCININNNIILQYDKDKIGILCERITSRMIYVPLDYKYKLKSTSTDSYNSVIYFSDNYDVSISIECPRQNYLILIAVTLSSYQIMNKRIVIDNELIDSNKIYKYIIEKGIFRGDKLVDTQKSFCVISQENIKAGENYAECETCKNSFINKHIHTYFEFNNTRICPYCRNDWNTDIFYCNKSKNDNCITYLDENVSYLEEL